MGPIDLVLHGASFLAPAAFLAVVLPLAARLLLRSTARRAGWVQQVVLVFIAGVIVLAGGLWWFGSDGRMATYAMLVVGAASSQWLVLRAWR